MECNSQNSSETTQGNCPVVSIINLSKLRSFIFYIQLWNSLFFFSTQNEDFKAEEEKLKAKYQLPSNWRGSGHSAFLQKKLAKGVSLLRWPRR